TPATCGVAIEVPLLRPHVPSSSVDRIELPGAATSITPRPRLENELRSVVWVSDDTVTTPSSSAGMSSHPELMTRSTGVESFGLLESAVLFARSVAALPAAAACTTPRRVENSTARRTASLAACWSGWSSHQYMNGST